MSFGAKASYLFYFPLTESKIEFFKNIINKLMVLPIEVWQIVLNNSEFIDQIHLTGVCKQFNNQLYIYDFYNVSNDIKDKLNDNIIKNYPKMQQLHVTTKNITNDVLNQMTNLLELDVSYMSHITNLNKLKKLKSLKIKHMTSGGGRFCVACCNVNDDGIKELDLIKLEMDHNDYVTNVNHMTNLKYLNAFGTSGLTNDGIKDLDLIEFIIPYTERVTDEGIKHMKNLKFYSWWPGT